MTRSAANGWRVNRDERTAEDAQTVSRARSAGATNAARADASADNCAHTDALLYGYVKTIRQGVAGSEDVVTGGFGHGGHVRRVVTESSTSKVGKDGVATKNSQRGGTKRRSDGTFAERVGRSGVDSRNIRPSVSRTAGNMPPANLPKTKARPFNCTVADTDDSLIDEILDLNSMKYAYGDDVQGAG